MNIKIRAIKSKSQIIILEKVVPLFAKAGYSGISMRTIAKEVGLNPATIYHHFPDKQTLYIEAMSHAFARKTEKLLEALSMRGAPEQRLEGFCLALCQLVYEDPDFAKLIQREILDGDELRLRLLAQKVFVKCFSGLSGLCQELAPGYDAHLLTISILGLVIYHYHSAPLRRFQPGSSPEHEDPQVIARHVIGLLLHGVKGKGGV